LSGLRDYRFGLSAIVSAADDGGSTGILRDELGVLPPGDVRQALVALSAESETLRDLFRYRFSEGSLSGHNFGNLFLSALEKVTGSFDKAVLEAGRILAITGQVIPVTSEKVRLQAEMQDGSLISGEHQIEEDIWSERSQVKRLWLEPNCSLHPLARQAIKKADLIVIGPGSVFTSLIPNLLVGGMAEALKSAKAPVVYVANLMTEKGQTNEYSVQDFVQVMEEYLGEGRIDYVVYNTKIPNEVLLERYKKEMERMPVRLNRKKQAKPSYELVGADLLDRQVREKRQDNDALAATRTLIRHNPHKLAEVLHAIMMHKLTKKYLKG